MTERERLTTESRKIYARESLTIMSMTKDELRHHYNEIFDRLQEYEVAEENNQIIVPPCKVGDTVWINNKYGTIKSKVSNITLIEDNRFLVKIHYDLRYCYDNHIETLGYVGYTEENFEFGKTVFLTKEEAEAALKGDVSE